MLAIQAHKYKRYILKLSLRRTCPTFSQTSTLMVLFSIHVAFCGYEGYPDFMCPHLLSGPECMCQCMCQQW